MPKYLAKENEGSYKPYEELEVLIEDLLSNIITSEIYSLILMREPAESWKGLLQKIKIQNRFELYLKLKKEFGED